MDTSAREEANPGGKNNEVLDDPPRGNCRGCCGRYSRCCSRAVPAHQTPAPTRVRAAPEGLKIALSNGFVNGWRLTLIDKFEEAEQLKAEGVVTEYSVVNAPGENSATEQASQIRSLMLQNPDVLWSSRPPPPR